MSRELQAANALHHVDLHQRKVRADFFGRLASEREPRHLVSELWLS